MRPEDQKALIWLYDEAVQQARETGTRQRIVWCRWPGRLNPCSTDFGAGFCCGEKPFTGFALWIPVGGRG